MTCHYCNSPLKTGLTFGTCPEFKCGTMYSVESPSRRDQTRKCVEAEVSGLKERIKRLEEAADASRARVSAMSPEVREDLGRRAILIMQAKETRP
jgi:hypothetical protein